MKKQHPNSRANLRPARKGEVRNPAGVNGWSKMRELAREQIGGDQESMLAKLIELANEGDVQALRLALSPVLSVHQIELAGRDGGPVELTFSELSKKAAHVAEEQKEDRDA